MVDENEFADSERVILSAERTLKCKKERYTNFLQTHAAAEYGVDELE